MSKKKFEDLSYFGTVEQDDQIPPKLAEYLVLDRKKPFTAILLNNKLNRKLKDEGHKPSIYGKTNTLPVQLSQILLGNNSLENAKLTRIEMKPYVADLLKKLKTAKNQTKKKIFKPKKPPIISKPEKTAIDLKNKIIYI